MNEMNFVWLQRISSQKIVYHIQTDTDHRSSLYDDVTAVFIPHTANMWNENRETNHSTRHET